MSSWGTLLLALALVQCVLAGPVIDDYAKSLVSKATDPKYRLPQDVIPKEYWIKLTPYLREEDGDKRFTFDGEVTILISASKAVDKIVLHAKYLNIISYSIDGNLTIRDNKTVEPYDFLELNLNSTLVPNTDYRLTFTYKGILYDDMHGFYKSSYQEGNVTKWLGTTQFQPVHARKAFPCFDEPSFKAVFKLSIECPMTFTCISNMERKANENGTLVSFQDTPKMSSYLLAFIVSQFEASNSDKNEKFKVWARPGAKSQSRYALDVGADLVDRMENYTMIKYYELKDKNNATLMLKMDQAAIPDFSAGAMENWGLLTYREAYLMVDATHTSTVAKQRVANILSHEIAHMWFGDLVTCHWWSDTWLNEGFARYFQYYLTHEVTPGFRLNDQFITAQIHTVMTVDSSLSSTPLSNINTNSPDEVSVQFGSITYNKGASIIRMIEHWVGPSTFKKALHVHLARKVFDVAVPKDLYTAIQDVANDDNSTSQYGFTVEQVFSSWVDKSGYPVLDVSMEHSDHSITVKQKRYLQDGEGDSTDLYLIPITYATKKDPNFSDTKPKFIMNNATGKIPYGDHSWVIFNVQQTGYYRVLYSEEMYNYILKDLADDNLRTSIHEYNRAQLVDDAFNFAKEGVLKYSRVFEIIQFLENDVDYTPWLAAFAGVNYIRPRFQTMPELMSDFEMHILRLMDNVVNHLGMEVLDNDMDWRKMFRSQALSLACAMGHQGCIGNATSVFKRWIDDKTFVIKSDLREHVYCNGLRHGEEGYFDVLWDKYLKENVVNEKVLILSALGCSKNQDDIYNLLSHTLDGNETIKAQDKMTAFNAAVTGNVENVEHAWGFFSLHIPFFRKTYGSVTGLIRTMASRMSAEQLTTLKQFLSGPSNLTEAEKTSGLASVDSAEKSLAWAKSNEVDIRDWIKSKYNSAGSVGASMMLMITMLVAAFARQ